MPEEEQVVEQVEEKVDAVKKQSAFLLHYCRNVRPTWVKFNSKDTKESKWCSRF